MQYNMAIYTRITMHDISISTTLNIEWRHVSSMQYTTHETGKYLYHGTASYEMTQAQFNRT